MRRQPTYWQPDEARQLNGLSNKKCGGQWSLIGHTDAIVIGQLPLADSDNHRLMMIITDASVDLGSWRAIFLSFHSNGGGFKCKDAFIAASHRRPFVSGSTDVSRTERPK
jgi:hypothetical protein